MYERPRRRELPEIKVSTASLLVSMLMALSVEPRANQYVHQGIQPDYTNHWLVVALTLLGLGAWGSFLLYATNAGGR